MNIFEEFNDFLKNRENSIVFREKRAEMPVFIMLRVLSNHPITKIFAEIWNLIKEEDSYYTYNALLSFLNQVDPHKKITYIKYPKVEKDDEIIEKISQYFEISREKAHDYYNYLTKQDLEFIKDVK